MTADHDQGTPGLPSEVLSSTDLDDALLLVVVGPTGETHVWTSHLLTPISGAAWLHEVADTMDPGVVRSDHGPTQE